MSYEHYSDLRQCSFRPAYRTNRRIRRNYAGIDVRTDQQN